MPGIFDIVNKRVVLNPNVLLIPELKAVYEKYDGDLAPFCYIHYITDPSDTYGSGLGDRLSEVLLKDFPGKYQPTDPCIEAAIWKIKMISATIEDGLLDAGREAAHKVRKAIQEMDISPNDPKTLKVITDILTTLPELIDALAKTELRRNEAKMRKNSKGKEVKKAYDQ